MFKFFQNLINKNKNSTEIKITAQLVFKDNNSPSRELLKEATALKDAKKIDLACEKLKEAYKVKGAEDLMIKELLRLPMYLQIAKKNDEGWQLLNDMNIKYLDAHSQAVIANQRRIFLQKEHKYTHALTFSIWSICKEIELCRHNIKESFVRIDQNALRNKKYNFSSMRPNSKTIYGHTPKGNPITNSTCMMLTERIEIDSSINGVRNQISSLLKKAKLEENIEFLSISISEYLRSTENYDLESIHKILNSVATTETI
ncbi:MAG: hypothetical protein COB46_08775 [Rhodospirillaceae bacterium]|nr:MAG: hypothetical protein COB46_08775 [Rhodospirillaceae bacterium]